MGMKGVGVVMIIIAWGDDVGAHITEQDTTNYSSYSWPISVGTAAPSFRDSKDLLYSNTSHYVA